MEIHIFLKYSKKDLVHKKLFYLLINLVLVKNTGKRRYEELGFPALVVIPENPNDIKQNIFLLRKNLPIKF